MVRTGDDITAATGVAATPGCCRSSRTASLSVHTPTGCPPSSITMMAPQRSRHMAKAASLTVAVGRQLSTWRDRIDSTDRENDTQSAPDIR
ncbi:hypothetical protein D3C86_2103620 [compost metagenome]